jgi:GGDEF domain-containing protein
MTTPENYSITPVSPSELIMPDSVYSALMENTDIPVAAREVVAQGEGFKRGMFAAQLVVGSAWNESERQNAEKDAHIAEQEELIDQLVYANEHDPLTGLLNKSAWQKDVAARMKLGSPMIVRVFDMDAFKAINDRFGHGRGDEKLIEFADRLRARYQRESDTIYHGRLEDSLSRWGGDEFATASNMDDREHDPIDSHRGDADRRQPKSFEEIVELEGAYIQGVIEEFTAEQPEEIRELGFGVSVGIAYWDPNTEPDLTPEEFFSRADAAMYAAKPQNKSR